MAPQYLGVFILPLIVATAWFGGGRPERTATAVILTAWALGLALSEWRIGRVSAGLALADLGLMIALGRLALRHDRWWLLVATSAQALAVAAHLALALRSDLSESANMTALAVFDALLLAALLGGVLERWLSGESRPATRLRAVRT